jgi:hypothetical protein
MPAAPASAAFDYDAFLSYSHADRAAARRLQRFIQRYRVPGSGARLTVFLDQTDLRSGELSQELTEALRRSSALLVCCSPAAVESRWVAQEIHAFLAQGGRPVVPIVLEGDAEAVIPLRLREREQRYLDLRGRRLLGLFGPHARVELARGIATIARRPLRELVDWEQRRQRVALLRGALALLVACAVALCYPLRYTRAIDVRATVGGLRALEHAEVQDDRLLLAARERSTGPQGGRDYVALYPDALASARSEWLDQVPFAPRTRLLADPLFDPQAERRLRAMDQAAIRRVLDARLAERAAEIAAQGLELAEPLAPRGPWVGEPAPGLFLLLFVIPPVPADPADLAEGLETEPAGEAIVAVWVPPEAARTAGIEGLDPGVAPETPRRSVNLAHGIPVAAAGEDLWLGLPAHAGGRAGGLWHSPDRGRSWSRIPRFSSVASIAAAPGEGARVIVATAPGRWKSGVREGTLQAALWERDARGEWRPLDHRPPFGGDSRLQLAGFFSDGALAVQVDESLYELGRDRVARRLFGRYRSAQPAE